MIKPQRIAIFFTRVGTILIPILLIVTLLSGGYWVIHKWDPGWFTYYENGRQPGLIAPVVNFIKLLGLIVTFSAAAVILVAISTFIRGLFGKWRTIKVFMSYEHQHLGLVENLRSSLKNKWIDPVFLPFEDTDHDLLIESVQREIRRCDMVIVLPGSERSFVDAEILTASSLQKPIAFIKITEAQRTPDTSYRGYPLFDLAILQEFQFRPLERFIRHVTGAAPDVMKSFYRTTVRFYKKKGFFVLAGFFACDTISEIVSSIVKFFVSPALEQTITTIVFWAFTAVAMIIFFWVYFNVIWERLRAIKITRQKTRSGHFTYELLSKGLDVLDADREILYCILEVPLPTRHEKKQFHKLIYNEA